MAFPQIPGYLITKQIGMGSFGRVFAAFSQSTSRVYCIKEASLPGDQKDRWDREVLPMSLNLPYICSVKHTFHLNNHYYIVMDLYPQNLTQLIYNQSQRRVLVKGTPLHPNLAWKIFGQLVEAVHSLNQENLCHRDIKPENIFLDDQLNAVLGDFGHSRTFASVNMFTTEASPAYHAPETFLHPHYGIEVDYFALGVVFYEMLVGELPYNPSHHDRNISELALRKVSDGEARKVIQQLMVPDPIVRASFFKLIYLKVRENVKRTSDWEPSISSNMGATGCAFSPQRTTSVVNFLLISDSSDSEELITSSSPLLPPTMSLPNGHPLGLVEESSSDDDVILVPRIESKPIKILKFTLYFVFQRPVSKQIISNALETLAGKDDVCFDVNDLSNGYLFSTDCRCGDPGTVERLEGLANDSLIKLPPTLINCQVFLHKTDLIVLLAYHSFSEVKQVLSFDLAHSSLILKDTYSMKANGTIVYEVSVLSCKETHLVANHLTMKRFPFAVTYSVGSRFDYVFKIGFAPSADLLQARKAINEEFKLKDLNIILLVYNSELLLFTSFPYCPIKVGNTFVIQSPKKMKKKKKKSDHIVCSVSEYLPRC
ncbi:hypothetical protein P9112_000712 [Eukaryota sp. TZLM1-RC]